MFAPKSIPTICPCLLATIALLFLISAGCTSPAVAPAGPVQIPCESIEPKAGPPEGQAVYLQSYKVGNLLAAQSWTFFPLPGTVQDPPSAFVASETQKGANLAWFIRHVVAPASWKKDSICYESGELRVTNTPKVHSQVKMLLDSLRESDKRLVTVSFRLLKVPVDFARQWDVEFKPLSLASAGHGYGIWAVVKRDSLAGWFDAMKTVKEVSVLTAPRLTLFQLQSGHLTLSEQRAFVSHYDEQIVGGARTFDPVVETCDSGLFFGAVCGVVPPNGAVGMILDMKLAQVSPERDVVTMPLSHMRKLEIPAPRETSTGGAFVIPADGTLLIVLPGDDPAKVLLVCVEPAIVAFDETAPAGEK